MKLKCILAQETASPSILPQVLSVYWVSVPYEPKKTSCTWQNLPSVNTTRPIQALSLWQSGHRAVLILCLPVAMGNLCSPLYNNPFFRTEGKCLCCSCHWKYKLATEDTDTQNSIIMFAWHLCSTFYNIKTCVFFITTMISLVCSPRPMFPFSFTSTNLQPSNLHK